MSDPTPRQQLEFTLNVANRGSVRVSMIDRITVDDVFRHLVDREIYRIITGDDQGNDVPQYFKDFLLKQRYTVR